MSVPVQKPGKSRQDYATPWELVRAIECRWLHEPFAFDLAADAQNAKAQPYFTEEDESLAQDWSRIRGWSWLNPPFADVEPWTKKCAERGSRVCLLTPASVGANWFGDYVEGKANVLFLSPRVTFVGESAPYPKDLMLSFYGFPPGMSQWRWMPRREFPR